MVVVTAKVSKAKIAAIVLVILVVIGLIVSLCSGAKKEEAAAEGPASLGSNEERLSYLQSLGWNVSETPVETQEVRIPEELPEVLLQYNELQKSQGYDLTDFCGKTVRRYVYEITNYPDTTDRYFVTLLIFKDQLIGGDVSSASQNGLMQGLQYPNSTGSQPQ